jgi:hypothetical protein
MEASQVVRELKRDALGRVELLAGPRGNLVRRVACGGTLPGSRFAARVLLARERAALERLAGVRGVARLVDAPDYARASSLDGTRPRQEDVLLRTWLEGLPLWAAEELPGDFFERLAELVTELHERGVCHNDLHKEPNVLVGADGRPCLVDFQLASCHARRGRRFASRAREDLRHVRKHERRYRTEGGRRDDGRAPPAERRSALAALWMHAFKPLYNLVTRRLLCTRDGEPRRPPAGPWPRWGAPLGPLR